MKPQHEDDDGGDCQEEATSGNIGSRLGRVLNVSSVADEQRLREAVNSARER